MVDVLFGRCKLTINENDLILEDELSNNDFRYLIITQHVSVGVDLYHPKIPKTEFNDLRTHGMIYTNDDLRRLACDKERSLNVTYWKFKIDLMEKYYG